MEGSLEFNHTIIKLVVALIILIGTTAVLETEATEEEIIIPVIHNIAVEEEPVEDISEEVVPAWYSNEGLFKSYMDYRTITARGTKQYSLQKSDNIGFNEYGIEIIDGALAIAIGTGHGFDIGDRVLVLLSNGNTLDCIVGDFKDDSHTEDNNIIMLSDRSIIEFIVDTNQVPSEVKLMGDFSQIDSYSGTVMNIYSE